MDISTFFLPDQLNHTSPTPLYLQIQEIIKKHITDYTLPPGSKLPPERELATLFAVSRTTAINAYRQLEQEGLIHTKIGSGTYVCEKAIHPTIVSPMPWSQLFSPHPQNSVSSLLRELVSTPASEENISLAVGLPDPSLYPFDIFNHLFREHSSNMNYADLGYIPTEGYAPLRQAISTLHNRKSHTTTTADNILVLSGSQQGVYLLSKIFLQPGDCVIIEAPSYIGAIQVFQNAGVRILTLPANAPLPLAILEDYLIRYRPKLFYTIPTFHNPTGRVMSLNERQELLRLAGKHQLIIVEDDPYSEFYYNETPPPSLKSLDHHNIVIHLSTFSKTLFPGLRTGWMIAPPPVINRIAMEKQYIDLHSNNISQWLLYLFLQENSLENHLIQMRKEYKKRRDIMATSIRRYCGPHLDFSMPAGGFYLWCKTNANISSQALLHEANKNGVSFVPGEAFYTELSNHKELRLCFATHSEVKLQEGIKRLGKTFSLLHQQRQSINLESSSRTLPII